MYVTSKSSAPQNPLVMHTSHLWHWCVSISSYKECTKSALLELFIFFTFVEALLFYLCIWFLDVMGWRSFVWLFSNWWGSFVVHWGVRKDHALGVRSIGSKVSELIATYYVVARRSTFSDACIASFTAVEQKGARLLYHFSNPDASLSLAFFLSSFLGV